MYDSPHWDWARGMCKKHVGQEAPCPRCIESKDADLFDADEVDRVIRAMHDTNLCQEVDNTLPGTMTEINRQWQGHPPLKA